MSWEDVELATWIAVVAASGFPPGQVAWEHQNANEPALDHLSMSFGTLQTIGIDRVATSQDLTRAPGQEIQQQIKGVREVSLELECFTSSVLGDAAARMVLEMVRSRLRLPSIKGQLRKAGLTPFDPGPVLWVPDIPSAQFRGRASCSIRCYTPVQVYAEYCGYIATINGTFTAYGANSSGPSGAAQIPFAAKVG